MWRPSQRAVHELLMSMPPTAVAAVDRLTYTKFLFMTRHLTAHDAARMFHALSIPLISKEYNLISHNTQRFFQANCIQYLDPALVAAELLQLGPSFFTFPFWDSTALMNLLLAWHHGFEKDLSFDIILQLPWIDEAEKFSFLKKMCMTIPCVKKLRMWHQNPGKIAACCGEEEAAKEYPQFLRPAFLRALDEAYPMHAAEVEEFLQEPVDNYPKSLILAAAASGREMMITQQILGSLTKIMADHPVHLALPFLKQVLDEDSDAILVSISSLLRLNDPVMIRQAYQICQALDLLPLVVGALPPMDSFWIQVMSVDSSLLDAKYFNRFLKEQLAATSSEGLLWTIRRYLELQVMGIPSMAWSKATKNALFDALPKLPSLLSSVPQLPTFFSLSRGAPTTPWLDVTPAFDMGSFAAAIQEGELDEAAYKLCKWCCNYPQVKHYLVSQYNKHGSLEVQKAVLYGNAQARMPELFKLQRSTIDAIVAAIDRADEARKAGYSKQEIWALFKIPLA